MSIGGINNGMENKALEAVQRLASESDGAEQPAGTPPANDVERLQEAMRVAEAKKTEEATLGDQVLDGIQATSQKIQEGRAEALNIIGKEDVTQVDLLRANFAMLEANTLVTAVSKTTEKITQGVKNLQQG